MSTLKVNRIEPRTGDSVDIVGFATGGRIVNTGTISYSDKIVLAQNTTNHKVMEWTIDKVDPKNKVMCNVVINGVHTRTKSTTVSSGVVQITTKISADGGTTFLTGAQMVGCCPSASISNPRDNWIISHSADTFEINNDSQQLNLSLTAVTYGNDSSDVIQLNCFDSASTLTWLEIEEI